MKITLRLIFLSLHGSMKKAVSILIGLLLSICVSASAHANWLADEARWHVSAHGQVACLDCHGDIPQAVTHPHPGDVNKRRGDFFRREQCEACHGTVVSEIKDGARAGKPLKPDQDYLGFLDCHDPHYPLKAGVVFVGNIIVDFNYEMMARVLKVPDEKFRDKVHKTLVENLSTIRRELGAARAAEWTEDRLNALMIEEFAAFLGPLGPKPIDGPLRAKMNELRPLMLSATSKSVPGSTSSKRSTRCVAA